MEEKLSTLFNFPNSLPRSSDDHNGAPKVFTYTLRGIIIDPNLTYFSSWEHYTNPFLRALKWYKSDFSSKPEVAAVDQGEVLTMARERGQSGVITVYVRDDVPETQEKVLPPEYIRVSPQWNTNLGIHSKR
jgi:hypothetical protein